MIAEIPRILLAEDSVNDKDLALAALSESGLANEVVWLENGQLVLDYLLCEGEYAGRTPTLPAVLLLDLKMPKVDGLEVLQRLKSHPALRVLPIVMLTSSSEERDVVKKAYRDFLRYYDSNPADADKLLSQGERKVPAGANKPELAALTMVANQLMNLDEVLNK